VVPPSKKFCFGLKYMCANFGALGQHITIIAISHPTIITVSEHDFWATVCKTVRPMLPYHCLSVCLSVCNVGVLWPNGCMDQDATWYRGRPRPRRHCVRWGPSSPTERGTTAPPTFRPMSTVAKWSPISATAELLFISVHTSGTTV